MDSLEQIRSLAVSMNTSDGRPTYSTQLYLLYSQIVEKTPYGQGILKRLTENPKVAQMGTAFLNRGSGGGQIDVRTIAMWFIWCAQQVGEEGANQILDAWLDAEDVEVVCVLWVRGVELEKSFDLEGGVSVKKIEDMPDSDEKEDYLTVSRDRLGFGAGHLPKCAITKTLKIKKLFASTNEAPNLKAMEFFHETRVLGDVASLLNALPGVVCVPYYQTTYFSGLTPVGGFGSRGGGGPVYDVSCHGAVKIFPDVQETLQELLTAFRKKDQPEQDRFRLILDRLSQAKRRVQIEDKVLDLGIALEMLLLDNDRDQLSLQFRIRGSWLMGVTFEDRLEKYQRLRRIYDARSMVAHSGALHRGNPKKLGEIRDEMPQFLALGEDIMRQIVIKGIPNWDGLILGQS